MSMENLLIILLPSGIFFIWSGWTLWKYLRMQHRWKACTEPVTAEIAAVERTELRNSTRYRYIVRYDWEDKPYTAEFRTSESFGELHEDAGIYVDPVHPDRIRVDCENLMEFSDLMLGCALVVIGLLCLAGGFSGDDGENKAAASGTVGACRRCSFTKSYNRRSS